METKFEIKFQITNPELVEIENWLKEELLKSNFGFYNNWNLIANAYSRNNIAILKDESNVIGLIIWSEYDRFVEIDIFEIRIEYRKKGIGRLFFNEISKHFFSHNFFTIKLFCEPEESEKFWKKMGFIKFPVIGYNIHELTYFKPLIEINQTAIQIDENNKLELWDLEPYQKKQNKPKWTWNINSENFIPILNPSNPNWNICWTKNGKIIKEDKVKYFSSNKNEIEFGSFIFITKLIQ